MAASNVAASYTTPEGVILNNITPNPVEACSINDPLACAAIESGARADLINSVYAPYIPASSNVTIPNNILPPLLRSNIETCNISGTCTSVFYDFDQDVAISSSNLSWVLDTTPTTRENAGVFIKPSNTLPIIFNTPPGYEFNTKHVDQVPIQTTVELNEIMCSKKCNQTPTCKGFNWSPLNRTCSLVGTFPEDLKYSSNLVSYKHISRNFTSVYNTDPPDTNFTSSAFLCDPVTIQQCNQDISNVISNTSIQTFTTNDIQSCDMCPPRTFDRQTNSVIDEIGVRNVYPSVAHALSNLVYNVLPQYVAKHTTTFEDGSCYKIESYVPGNLKTFYAIYFSNVFITCYVKNIYVPIQTSGVATDYSPTPPLTKYIVFSSYGGYCNPHVTTKVSSVFELNPSEVDYVENGYFLKRVDDSSYLVAIDRDKIMNFQEYGLQTKPDEGVFQYILPEKYSRSYNNLIHKITPATYTQFYNYIHSLNPQQPLVFYHPNDNIPYFLDPFSASLRQFLSLSDFNYQLSRNSTWNKYLTIRYPDLYTISMEVFWNNFPHDEKLYLTTPICPAGEVIKTITSFSFCERCPAGTYASTTLACSSCSTGQYCPTGSASPQQCPAGYYCPNPSRLVACPAGSYCPVGSSSNVLCSSGSYCPTKSSQQQNCPPGNYCTTPASIQVCPAGSYCPIRSVTPTPCITGSVSVCPTNTSPAYYCPMGSGGTSSGAPLCAAGYYCPTVCQQLPNPPGTTSLPGAPTPTACPTGSYFLPLILTDILSTIYNQVNTSTPGPSCYACPTGSNANGTNTGCVCSGANQIWNKYTNTCLRICNPGTTSDPFAYSCQPCTGNTYTDRSGVPGCISCPTGAIANSDHSGCICTIENGTAIWSSRWNRCGISSCNPGYTATYGRCLPTNVRPRYNGNYYLSTSSYSCPAMYTFSPNPIPSWWAGTFQDPLNDIYAFITCTLEPQDAAKVAWGHDNVTPKFDPSSGTISYGSRLTWNVNISPPYNLFIGSGSPCNLGAQVSGAGCALCTSGNYCPPGTTIQQQCPEGYYCPTPSQIIKCSVSQSCGPGSITAANCPSGRICPNGGSPINCPAGFYCPLGSTDPLLCLAGDYCPLNSSAPSDCPAGYYCPDPSQILSCPACPPRSTTYVQCPAGSYCPGGGKVISCITGDYCPAGSTSNTSCLPGYYCPDPTQQIACPAKQYQPRFRMINSSACLTCPIGYYCPQPGTSKPTQCPTGTFCTDSTGNSIYVTCPGGHYCISPATSPMLCPAGMVCPQGTSNLNYNATITNSLQCPAGTYSSLTDPICHACPAGTYSPTIGATSSSTCQTCPAGVNCPIGSPSYDSTELTAYFTATNDKLCLAGTYYDTNTKICTMCPFGQYISDSVHDFTQCLNCSPNTHRNGYYSMCCTPTSDLYYKPATITSCGPGYAFGPPTDALNVGGTCVDGFDGRCDACTAGVNYMDVTSTTISQCKPCTFYSNTQAWAVTQCTTTADATYVSYTYTTTQSLTFTASTANGGKFYFSQSGVTVAQMFGSSLQNYVRLALISGSTRYMMKVSFVGTNAVYGALRSSCSSTTDLSTVPANGTYTIGVMNTSQCY